VAVLAHTYQVARSIHWVQASSWPINDFDGSATAETLRTIVKKAYKIGLQIGGLFLAVLYNPFSNVRIRLWLFRHIPLYPRGSYPCIWKQPDRAWPSNITRRFYTFLFDIGLVFGDWSRYPERAELRTKKGPVTIVRSDDLIGD